MIYVIALLGDAGDGTISSTLAVADTEARAMAVAKAMLIAHLGEDDYEEDRSEAHQRLIDLVGLKKGMTSDEYLQIAWTLNMPIKELWEIFFDWSLNFDDNPELLIRSFAENGMDSGGFWFSLGGQ